jgi:hypothetical protein
MTVLRTNDRAASVAIRPLRVLITHIDTAVPISMRQLFRSHGDHYDVYEGGQDYDRVVNVEVEFLHRHAQAPAL